MNKKIVLFFSLLLCLVLPFTVLAADYITTVLQNFLNKILWPILVAGVAIMLIYAGFLFVTSAGDPTKASTAKKALIFAIIGLAIALLSFSVVGIVKSLFSAPSGGGGGGGGGNEYTGTCNIDNQCVNIPGAVKDCITDRGCKW